MNIAICDDEQEYIDDAEKHLNLYFNEHGISYDLYKFDNSTDILNSSVRFDIAFLDVEIDHIDGIEIGRQLKNRHPDMVLIFITAYNHYMDKAMDIGIVRFFEKPINSARFYEGLKRAIALVDDTELKIFFKDEHNGFIRICGKDIIYVEISGRKTKVITKDNTYFSKDNINTWHHKLNKSFFDYPHKSFIINTNYVTYYCRDFMVLDDVYTIPIAYSKKGEFSKKFSVLMES